MNELKTLKDFEEFRSCISKIELKQEAIKWVKELPHIITKEDWIDFFNLTEEDLK